MTPEKLEKLKELEARQKVLKSSSNQILSDMQGIADESRRVADVAHNADKILTNLDEEFESQTGLTGVDASFLFTAIALQCLRQYVLTDFKIRNDAKTEAENTKGKGEEHSNRKHGWYNPSLDEIISSPVPFDAIYGSPDFNLDLGGGYNHRVKTLGHDPLLGWVFGTMNIATSTVTCFDFMSYHVKTGMTSNAHARDKITNHADTQKVFSYTMDKLLNGGMDGKTKVGASLIKEAIHLKSDINSKSGLPLPVISTISPQFATELAKYGIDMANVLMVGKQATLSIAINAIIAMVHRLLYEETKYTSYSMFEVKTRKILLYSNAIATSSNAIYVGFNCLNGNADALRKLDIGGALVTLYRLFNDVDFIHSIKREFVFGEFDKLIRGCD